MFNNIIFLSLSILQVVDYGLPTTSEPRPPRQLSSSFTMRCGTSNLNITGHGFVRPPARRPVVSLNGREVAGAAADRLRADLSMPNAVYLLTGVCPEPASAIQLHIYTAQKVSGEIRYRSGRAQFHRGTLNYTGLEDANAETFWFR